MITSNQWKCYELQANVIQAMAHPIRIAIVEVLRNGEVCVCDIAERIDTDRSNVSRHLAVMTHAGILNSRKDGLQVFYSLQTPCVLNFLACATQTLKQNLKQQAKAIGKR